MHVTDSKAILWGQWLIERIILFGCSLLMITLLHDAVTGRTDRILWLLSGIALFLCLWSGYLAIDRWTMRRCDRMLERLNELHDDLESNPPQPPQ